MKFVSFPATLFAVLMMTPVGHARIGETRTECAERYGEPVGTAPARLAKSEGDADVFKAGVWKITVEYRKDKVWMIAYSGSSLNRPDVEGMLAKNSGDASWKHGSFLGAEHWIAKGKNLHAAHFLYPTRRLVVMTKASLGSEWNPPRLKEESSDKEGEGKPEGEAEKAPVKSGRLEGL